MADVTQEMMTTEIAQCGVTDEPQEEAQETIEVNVVDSTDQVDQVENKENENKDENENINEEEVNDNGVNEDVMNDYGAFNEEVDRWFRIQETIKEDMNKYGFNPAAFCWECFAKIDDNGDGVEYEEDHHEFQARNIPQLQSLYHFEGKINDDTYVFMDTTEDSGDSICLKPTRLADVAFVYDLVKFPPPTWEILDDNLSLYQRFEQFDTNIDDYITKDEVKAYFDENASNMDAVTVQQKIDEIWKADENKDGKISIWEFKSYFMNEKKEFFNDDWKIRLSRYLFTVLIPILMMLLLFADPSIPISSLIGISIQFMYMIYFATLGYYFYKASHIRGESGETRYLYRVFSKGGQAVIPEGKWAPLSLTINQVAWPLKPIHSVSEFSAVDGAIPAVMLSNIGQYTWAMVTMHFMIQIAIYEDFSFKFSDVIELIGVAGLVMLGVFEADPYNKSVNIFHMIGAFMGFGTVVGYVVQQFESEASASEKELRETLSWLLALLFIVFYTMWNITLSVSYFGESRSWGIYEQQHIENIKNTSLCGSDEMQSEQDNNEEDPTEALIEEDSCNWLCCGEFCCMICLAVVAGICIIAGLPLLCILCISPIFLCAAGKSKKGRKKRAAEENKDANFDFQPALPNWWDYITPEIKKTITAYSTANVMFEGIVLLVGSTALSLWLMGYERQCDGLCADQLFMLIFLCLTFAFGVYGSYSLLGIFNSKKYGQGVFSDGICGLFDKL